MDARGAADGGVAAATAATMVEVVIRTLVKVHAVLSLGGLALVLCIATLHDHLHPLLGNECAATDGYAAILRTHRLLLALSSGAQAAAAATVAAFFPKTRRLRAALPLAVSMQAFSVFAYFQLLHAFAAAAVGGCPGRVHAYKAEFIVHDVLLWAPLYLSFALAAVALVRAL